MTGSRKYRFAWGSLAALVAGFAFAAWRTVPADLFEEYVFGLFLLVAGFGVPNGIEHVAGAWKTRRAPEVKP